MLVWTCTACGILVKLLVQMTRLSSAGVYLCMGWLLVSFIVIITIIIIIIIIIIIVVSAIRNTKIIDQFLGGGKRVIDSMPKKSFVYFHYRY